MRRGIHRRLMRPLVMFLALVAVLCSLTGLLGSADATFVGQTENLSSSFSAATLHAPGAFTVSRPCPSTAAAAWRASTYGSTLGGTSMSITRPTTAVGDYLVMAVETYANGSTPATINTPAGWTLLANNFANGADFDVRLAVFGLATPASPPASYSVSFSGIAIASGILTSYSGITGLDTSASAVGITATATAPSVTATTANSMFVTILAHTNTSATTPAGMTAGPFTNPNGAGMRKYHQVLSASGATGTRSSAINATNPAWVAASVLLKANAAGYDPTVNLSWTASSDTWATGYEITRSPGSTISVSGQSTVAYTDSTTTSGTAYTYTIKTVYGSWRSAGSSDNAAGC
jgi:hypothetical protein